MPHLKAGRKNPSGIPLMFAEPDLGLGGVSSDLHAPSGLVSYGLGSPPLLNQCLLAVTPY